LVTQSTVPFAMVRATSTTGTDRAASAIRAASSRGAARISPSLRSSSRVSMAAASPLAARLPVLSIALYPRSPARPATPSSTSAKKVLWRSESMTPSTRVRRCTRLRATALGR
jgi:hypothetical protein